MPPENKKIKLQIKSDELINFQNEIKKINITEVASDIYESDPLIDEDNEPEYNDDIKKYIKEQIKSSERRIHQRLDRIEKKINRLLEQKYENETVVIESSAHDNHDDTLSEEHIIEDYANENDGHVDEFSEDLFPINEEEIFDWFMARLRDDDYRSILVEKRWQLTKTVGTRSFNVSVKDFIRMHFDLSVCIKYSVSGYGSRGTKKKKLDSQTLTKYVYECFEKSTPGVHNLQDVSKAITVFWGRSQDCFHKSSGIKRESPNYTISVYKKGEEPE